MASFIRAHPHASAFALAVALATAAAAANAYVGPGAGFAVVTSFFAVGASFALAALALLTLPFRRLLRARRRRRALARAQFKRVVILGLDGLSPAICRELMAAGRLPHYARLAAEGTFRPLATTVPPVSPCAWSTFQTGTSPARHGIFDFLARDRATYLPVLSSTRIRPSRRRIKLGPYIIPLGKPAVQLLRAGVPFWKILGANGVFANVIRVPITFPPEKFHGVSLSAMCVPDLLGTQGTFTYFAEDGGPAVAEGGRRVAVTRVGPGAVEGRLAGPDDPLRPGRTLSLPFRVTPGRDGRGATLRLGGDAVKLELGKYTPWTPVVFRGGLGVRVRGAARFLLKSLSPFALYVTPLNVDPDKPALPLSHPFSYAVYLSKLLDRYATLGLAEDTWALNEGVLSDGDFLDQVWTHHAEREAMLVDALAKTPEGVVVCVFDTPDRVQHMFFRYRVPGHPAARGRDGGPYANAIDDAYVRMDELVGRTRAALGPEDLLLVISDHGFASFERGVNLNAWLRAEGYLTLREGEPGGKWFAGVDWSRTRAYALGLAGLYLNVRGREARGVVPPAEVPALKAELAAKLAALKDEERGRAAVREVYDLARLYRGPYLDAGPDLVVGYEAGYRISWDGATGGTAGPVVEDNTRAWSGDHCVAAELVPGCLFATARIDADHPHMMDVAPTVLSLFGVAAPPHMEGKPWPVEAPAAPPPEATP